MGLHTVLAGAVAMAMPLAWQLANMAGWVSQNITNLFENVGIVQDGMRSITAARQMPDPPGARALCVSRGEVRFEQLRFGYGTERGVLRSINLTIAPGERVGLVGASGAGKSTLVHLLLHFYEPEQGRILLDGQDVATTTQESLRAAIAMVTQDTSLLHRSIRDNIRYGRPGASDAEVEEATSALDSEVEAAIQEQLETLMSGRTVIAIAHRLSTIARMDRLVVLDHGQIAETGTHAALLSRGGAYARLWQRQSGGFMPTTPGQAILPARRAPAILDTAGTQR